MKIDFERSEGRKIWHFWRTEKISNLGGTARIFQNFWTAEKLEKNMVKTQNRCR